MIDLNYQLKTIGGTKLEFVCFSKDINLIYVKALKLGIDNHILIEDLDEQSKEKVKELRFKE